MYQSQGIQSNFDKYTKMMSDQMAEQMQRWEEDMKRREKVREIHKYCRRAHFLTISIHFEKQQACIASYYWFLFRSWKRKRNTRRNTGQRTRRRNTESTTTLKTWPLRLEAQVGMRWRVVVSFNLHQKLWWPRNQQWVLLLWQAMYIASDMYIITISWLRLKQTQPR